MCDKLDFIFLYKLQNSYVDCSELLEMINFKMHKPTPYKTYFSYSNSAIIS